MVRCRTSPWANPARRCPATIKTSGAPTMAPPASLCSSTTLTRKACLGFVRNRNRHGCVIHRKLKPAVGVYVIPAPAPLDGSAEESRDPEQKGNHVFHRQQQ